MAAATNKSDSLEVAYYILIAVAFAIIIAFSYMTYLFYKTTKGSYAFKFTIVIPLPIIVALILLVLLFAAGKKAVAQELRAFLTRNQILR